jgi:CDGSH-type Zn-finger protein
MGRIELLAAGATAGTRQERHTADSAACHPRALGTRSSDRRVSIEGGPLIMAEVTIETRPNGPYIVNGSVELRDANGDVVPTQARIALCRCGASTKKPFCDGTHSKIGFQAAAQVVPDSTEKS